MKLPFCLYVIIIILAQDHGCTTASHVSPGEVNIQKAIVAQVNRKGLAAQEIGLQPPQPHH